MKKTVPVFGRALCMALTLLAATKLLPAATINSSTPCLNGANIPWNSFGKDFGTHPTLSAGYNATWWDSTFAAMAAQKMNGARICLHYDSRASPEFNASGDVIGIGSNLVPNLQDMQDKANTHGIKVQLYLWSFDMCKDFTGNVGSYAGLHEHKSMAVAQHLSPPQSQPLGFAQPVKVPP